MMDDYPVIGYGVAQNQPLATPIPREKVVLTVLLSKGQNPELLEMFNEGLKEMKRTGEYDKIIGTYVKDGNEAKEETADESTFVGFMQNNWKQLLHGLWMTILLTLISFVLALIVGVILGYSAFHQSKHYVYFQPFMLI